MSRDEYRSFGQSETPSSHGVVNSFQLSGDRVKRNHELTELTGGVAGESASCYIENMNTREFTSGFLIDFKSSFIDLNGSVNKKYGNKSKYLFRSLIVEHSKCR